MLVALILGGTRGFPAERTPGANRGAPAVPASGTPPRPLFLGRASIYLLEEACFLELVN